MIWSMTEWNSLYNIYPGPLNAEKYGTNSLERFSVLTNTDVIKYFSFNKTRQFQIKNNLFSLKLEQLNRNLQMKLLLVHRGKCGTYPLGTFRCPSRCSGPWRTRGWTWYHLGQRDLAPCLEARLLDAPNLKNIQDWLRPESGTCVR